MQLINPSTSSNELNTTLTPHSIIHGHACFAYFNKVWGIPLGAIIAFMFWIWLSIIVVLLGAELNAETEHQTARDTTTGRPKPLGARGAKMADTVGATQDK